MAICFVLKLKVTHGKAAEGHCHLCMHELKFHITFILLSHFKPTSSPPGCPHSQPIASPCWLDTEEWRLSLLFPLLSTSYPNGMLSWPAGAVGSASEMDANLITLLCASETPAASKAMWLTRSCLALWPPVFSYLLTLAFHARDIHPLPCLSEGLCTCTVSKPYQASLKLAN